MLGVCPWRHKEEGSIDRIGQDRTDNVMLWATSCVDFFGFIRSGEFTVPSQQGYDPTVHLSLAYVAFNSHVAPTFARLRIKKSKTDPFLLEVDVFIGATS